MTAYKKKTASYSGKKVDPKKITVPKKETAAKPAKQQSESKKSRSSAIAVYQG